MRENDPLDIVVVSDLHMAAGRDPVKGTMSPYEDFHQDKAFVSLLDDLHDRAIANPRKLRLLILGDVCDFLHVRMSRPDSGDGPDARIGLAIAKLERIAEGHPTVFDALGRLVAAGCPVDIVPGNHDIELMCQSVQERFVQLVSRASNVPDLEAGIRFHPWIYHVPGMLYAEHGHQHHDITSFRRLLCFDYAQTPDATQVPFGSLYDDYLFELLESLDPSRRMMAPPLRSVVGVVRRNPSILVTRSPMHLRHAWILARRLASSGRRGNVSARAAYRNTVVRRHASDVGLPGEALQCIDRLAEVAVDRMWRRIGMSLLRGQIQRIRWPIKRRTAVGHHSSQSAVQQPGYLSAAAFAIHQILSDAGHAVPCYVFGHTHVGAKHSLTRDAEAPQCQYLNSGTWTVAIAPTSTPDDGRERFPFVCVSRESGGGVTAQLMVWDSTERSTSVLA